ncbi:MAG: hypothetical protein LBH04_12355, partial [Tannerellaceae bacterium]|nr:hypothetical protein [Tannerellaceae bacterium]
MKRRILSLALLLAIATGSLMADGTLITLDLSRPTVPSSFPLASNRIWTGTYSNAYPEISFNNGIFRLSHVVDRDAFGSENQWGYWDGFTYSKNGDNTNYGAGNSQNWVACQFGNMAGGGIQTDAAGNVRKDASGAIMADRDIPYLVAYWGYYKILFGSSVRQTLEVTLDNIYKAV